ncbi:MAG: hypothetical protein CL843_07245 [Crocinitomicaceae bacterium]|nr:hypothetical protein [Crocinitomicaceae bacterium]|tara:strand:+ start:6572 stop:7462 length:891 start_codon:yes stop_codon:yes gene_type:complete
MKLRAALLFVIVVITTSGIIRHDVPDEAYIKFAQQPQFDCAGLVTTPQQKDEDGGGSCVLISKKYVLTAAHIFIESDTKSDTIEYNGMPMVVYTPINKHVAEVSKFNFIFDNVPYKAKRVTLHPMYLDSNGNYDIALVELQKPVKDIDFPKLNTAFNELNSKVVGVGFGAFCRANLPGELSSDHLKIAGENIIDSIGGYTINNQAAMLYFDFDHPTDTTCCNKMGSPIPETLEYITAGGDSGCGLFRQKNEEWELIGICSGGGVNVDQLIKSGYYGQIASFTRVSTFYNWIQQEMK